VTGGRGWWREFQWAWNATCKDMPGGAPWFSWYCADRRVTCCYAYIWDDRVGPGFIKICSYAPYPVKVWVNGHEAVRRMAAAAGLAVTPLASGFAACADPHRLQELCDQLGAAHLRMFFRIKVDLKEDPCLRIEVVCNDPAGLGCKRGLHTTCPSCRPDPVTATTG
jgi:hypothetical protein